LDKVLRMNWIGSWTYFSDNSIKSSWFQ